MMMSAVDAVAVPTVQATLVSGVLEATPIIIEAEKPLARQQSPARLGGRGAAEDVVLAQTFYDL